VAALGIALAVLGAWMVVKLGPSGEATFSVTSNAVTSNAVTPNAVTSNAPGAIVVTPEVLNSVDVPVRVTATRRDGGAVRLAAASSADASTILAGAAVATVSGVHYPAGTLTLRQSGAGALTDISTADVWRLLAEGKGSVEMVVDQGRGPETAVVTSGDSTPLTDVTMTLTWAARTWFFEALAATMIGAMTAAFALIHLWRSRAVPRGSGVSGATTSQEVT
jgi:hypothetical protein